MDVLKTQVMLYLKAQDPAYFGKVLELRKAVGGWLNYVPQTFPHYTRHTIEHSDEIVLQMSKLLFRDDDIAKPVIRLSPIECYIAISSALLHDAGMVASDKERASILESEEWRRWTSGEGAAADRWNAIQKFRTGGEPDNSGLRNFLSDVQTRFMLAEFIRRGHHRRTEHLLQQHQNELAQFAFQDTSLLRAISNVCVAHGLRQNELEDNVRFPEECDIRGERANVRFLAILLRLGDLLDLSTDRACPLLLNAASPLPAESLAHWTQYKRMINRLTSPDRIEIAAECETQEEHRALQDWCHWLVDELDGARALMSRARRHREWVVPEATLTGPDPTIEIKPAAGATYFPSEWKIELDNDTVLALLTSDVYASGDAFIRELLQNAFDANRCQMYLDMERDGERPPGYPNEVSEERRDRYPVYVTLEKKQMQNELSGREEEKQVLVVEDSGIGMDKAIIKNYFLQVGRSYYTSDEFRRNFGFVPTSKFGVGFLSVFGASDNVVVDTYKPSSSSDAGPVRITLAGPRNYLLTEKGERHAPGTRIEVALNRPLDVGDLTDMVTAWCRRVEFPIFLDELGRKSLIRAERMSDFTAEAPDVSEAGAKFLVRGFPIAAPGIAGEIYVFARKCRDVEDWTWSSYEKQEYEDRHPQARIPLPPPNVACLHGISIEEILHFSHDLSSLRLDIRRPGFSPTLGRDRIRGLGLKVLDIQEVRGRYEAVILEHLGSTPLALGEKGWRYRQRLMQDFKFLGPFWKSVSGTVRVFVDGEAEYKPVEQLETGEVTLAVPVWWSWFGSRDQKHESWLRRLLSRIGQTGEVMVTAFDARRMAKPCVDWVLGQKKVTRVRYLSNSVVGFTFAPQEAPATREERAEGSGFTLAYADYPGPDPVAYHVVDGKFGPPHVVLLNSRNPLVQWYLRASTAMKEGRFGLNKGRFDRLTYLLANSTVYTASDSMSSLSANLAGLREMQELPADLRPPGAALQRADFEIKRRKPSGHPPWRHDLHR